MNLERTWVLIFYHSVYLKVNLDLEKTNQLGESSHNFIFTVVNLDPIVLKRWTDGESWPNDFVEKVNRGEDGVGRFKMPFDACIYTHHRSSATETARAERYDHRILWHEHETLQKLNFVNSWSGIALGDGSVLLTIHLLLMASKPTEMRMQANGVNNCSCVEYNSA